MKKNNCKINRFPFFAAILLFLPVSSLLSTESASVHSGKLHVLYSDDFKNKKHDALYFLESSESGTKDGTENPRHQPLDFEGNTPAGLRTGQRLEISGSNKGGHGRLSVQNYKILPEAPAPALDATPTGTPDYHGPMATYTATPTCHHSCLAILLNFNDKTLACSPSEVDSVAFSSPTSVSSFYRENTFNGFGLQGTTIGPFTIPYSSSSCDPYGFASAANQAALAAGFNPDAYDHVMYILPDGACPYGGLGELSGKKSWLYYCNWTEVYAHELGHNLGLHHASSGSQEYGDDSDVMGYSLHDFNGPHKAELESHVCFNIPPKIETISGCGVYTLYALESPNDNDEILKIAKPDTGGYYWISYRAATGVDTGLSSTYAFKTNIHQWSGSDWNQTHFLGAESDGASYVDSVNNITITQLSHDQHSCRVSISIGSCPATATSTITATSTATATNTRSATPTPTPTSPASSSTPSATPTSAPSLEPTPHPSPEPSPTPQPEICPAQIDKIMITPNPQQASADRMVSLKLGCSADEVDVQIYSSAGSLLFSWSVANIHVDKGQWVHLRYPHEVQLPNGAYFVKVSVTSGGTKANGSATFMVLN